MIVSINCDKKTIVKQIIDIILDNEQRLGPGLYSGKIGVSILLLYFWKVVGNDYYYNKATKLAEEAFDYLTLQSHRIYWNSNIVDLSVSNGCTGILLGLILMTKKDWIECAWEEVAVSLDPAIFGSMIDKLLNGKEHNSEILSLANYAMIRDSRFAKEYLKRFINEWTSEEKVVNLKDVLDNQANMTLKTLNEKANRFSRSLLPPDKWYTTYKGLYRLHFGLMDGLAGIGLSLLRNEKGYDDDWKKYLL